jgi:hypothetical protein
MHPRRLPMSTQTASGSARQPASVAVAPLISPAGAKVSAEKPGGAGRSGAPPAQPAARSSISSTATRPERDGFRRGAIMADLGAGGWDVARPCCLTDNFVC